MQTFRLCSAINYGFVSFFFLFFFFNYWSSYHQFLRFDCNLNESARDSVMTSAGVGLSSITVSPIYKSSQSVSHQSICYAETEHVLSVNGKESSIILDLQPNRIQLGPCKRTFKAPEPHGFIVKLLKFKSKQMRNPNSHIDTNTGGVSMDVYNETTTCPLNIVSS